MCGEEKKGLPCCWKAVSQNWMQTPQKWLRGPQGGRHRGKYWERVTFSSGLPTFSSTTTSFTAVLPQRHQIPSQPLESVCLGVPLNSIHGGKSFNFSVQNYLLFFQRKSSENVLHSQALMMDEYSCNFTRFIQCKEHLLVICYLPGTILGFKNWSLSEMSGICPGRGSSNRQVVFKRLGKRPPSSSI